MPDVFNATEFSHAPIAGQAATIGAVAVNAALILAAASSLVMGKRRKRHDTGFPHTHPHPQDMLHDSLFQEMLYKVVNDLDDPSCLALGLCHAISLPPHKVTTAHRSMISMLTPYAPTPFVWPELNKPTTKYQYAALVGEWARLTNKKDQCRITFPSCSISPDEVIIALAQRKISCTDNSANEKHNF